MGFDFLNEIKYMNTNVLYAKNTDNGIWALKDDFF